MWGDRADSAEYQEVTAVGIKFYNLLAGKFYRTYSPLKLLRVPWGFIQAIWWLGQIRPQVIVSFGGYLAVPTVMSGWLLRIPAVTHEQTVAVGWANRAIAPFAQKIAVTWPTSLNRLPKNKAEFVGLPLRPEIVRLRKHLKPNPYTLKPVIYITGGKQGAHVVNEAVFENIRSLTRRYRIIHQTGYRDYPQAMRLNLPGYVVFDFDSRRAIDSLGRADVVVSRAGAHAVYELGFLGKRSVLVPIPWVSHDEQAQNAQILVEAGLGIIVPEDKLTGETLIATIEQAKRLTGQPLNLPVQADRAMVQLIEQVANYA